MKITWYGHACFQVESSCGSVVFDPYAPGSVPGLSLPADLTADAVVCSHDHHDHNFREGVRLTGFTPSFTLSSVNCFHDDARGAKRGPNRITVLEADGLRLAHFGDVGHMLSDEAFDMLGRLDVVMIPVGGFYTVDAAVAKKICDRLQPGHIIPMHYRTGDVGYSVLAEPAGFTAQYSSDDVQFLNGSSADVTEFTGKVVVFA